MHACVEIAVSSISREEVARSNALHVAAEERTVNANALLRVANQTIVKYNYIEERHKREIRSIQERHDCTEVMLRESKSVVQANYEWQKKQYWELGEVFDQIEQKYEAALKKLSIQRMLNKLS